MSKRLGRFVALVLVAGLVVTVAGAGAQGSAPVPQAAGQAACPSVVAPGSFASAAQLRKQLTKAMSFGQRNLASASHRRLISWLEREVKRIDRDFRLRSDPFRVWRWLPRTHARGGPGLDIARAGGLSLVRPGGKAGSVPVAGAVHWSKPGTRKGRLVYLGPDDEITAANAKGRVVIRDFPSGSLPFSAFGFVGLYITPDLASETGDYARPYINELQQELLAAGRAGAAGVVFAFDVPRRQVRGYYDPHTGTLYRLPAVFVGSAEARRLKALARQGRSARIAVRAKVDRAMTRNVIATLPGQSKEKIVLAANTDGNSWVQENGIVGMLAVARYYARLPLRCRPRTLELAFASAHDTLVSDGTDKYAEKLNETNVAFAFSIEHLGTREIIPTGQGPRRHLEFTGKGDPFLFAAGDSDVLRQTAIATTQRRRLDRTAVLQGIGVPDAARVPPICSMGGLGIAFHRRLIPTLAMISGPWTLYDPAFGRRAIDFRRMRSQALAVGDSILALDELPTDQIAGDYLSFRERLAQGAPTCPREVYPQFAPGP
ncbi:MAG: hypothetical protein JW895_04515 [Thermoleophilaceae bacterium]|nr:hypothetical protein [Thermoleophilaceae bacterium]